MSALGDGSPATRQDKFAFKVVFLGDSGVGKTCLATRYEKGTFSTNSASTIGAAFSTTTIEVNGALVKIQMWDTAGQERYHCLAPMYYREAAGAFVVYDAADATSFEKAKVWIGELKKNQPSCLILLLGNKIDLRTPENADKCVPTDLVRQYAEHERLLFMEVSAKTGEGVAASLQMLAEAVLKKSQTQKRLGATSSVATGGAGGGGAATGRGTVDLNAAQPRAAQQTQSEGCYC